MQQKSLFTYWLECFTKHYADFSGRARRREYWGTILFNVLIQIGLNIILYVVDTISFSSLETTGGDYFITFIVFANQYPKVYL